MDGVISSIRIVSMTMGWSHLRGTKISQMRGRNWVKIIGFLWFVLLGFIIDLLYIYFFFLLRLCPKIFFFFNYLNMWIVLKIFLFIRICKLSKYLAKCFYWYSWNNQIINDLIIFFIFGFMGQLVNFLGEEGPSILILELKVNFLY